MEHKKKILFQQFCFNNFVSTILLLGFFVDFAWVDYINKVHFVNIIYRIKCPPQAECVSIFFSEFFAMKANKNQNLAISSISVYYIFWSIVIPCNSREKICSKNTKSIDDSYFRARKKKIFFQLPFWINRVYLYLKYTNK